MNFEALMQSEALRPLVSVFALQLMDDPDTAAIVSRMSPSQTARLYHTALVRAPSAVPAQAAAPPVPEQLCAAVLSTYALRVEEREEAFALGMCGSQAPSAWPVLASDGPQVLHLAPLPCRRLAELEDVHPGWEEALAAREVQLQHCIASLAAGAVPAAGSDSLPTHSL
ncbi:hypothetical protein NESM_000668300 [Novymonas esmeraldas]|uniref:Uncharacterized protein n=1 Tax=Novymonas esmeraldas TaxID=1808958 RepID=A0AAW0EUY2_9TRYP